MDLIRTSLKAFSLLDRRMRLRWLALVPIAVVAALLESIGALLILGLIRLITESSSVAETPIVGTVRGYLSGTSDERFLIYYAIVVALFYGVKNAIKFAEVYVRASAANDSLVVVASQLLKRYLSAPYTLFLERTSVEFVRNVHEAAHTLCHDVLSSTTAAFSELLVLIGVLGILFYAAPGSTLVACILLAVVTVVLLRMTQSQFRRWGKRLHTLHLSILKNLQEGFRGIKDIKVLGREDFFAKNFAEAKERVCPDFDSQ